MELVALVLACVALFFSLCAFIASAATAVIVIGWKSSTHKIVQLPATLPETQEVFDLPPDVLAQMPSSPETRTPEQYIRDMQREAASLEDMYEPSF